MSQAWDATDPANRRMDEQRDERFRLLVAGLGRPVRRALDLGCGRGGLLPALELPGVGVDVGITRLRLAPVPVAQADGARLPFPDRAFDLVVLANVISSIPDPGTRRTVADEVRRVLTDDGVVLWYDQRWPNPTNRTTRPVGRQELAALFPNRQIDVEPITVAAPVARLLPRRYDLLHRFRPLRTHLIGVVRRGQASAR